MSVTFPLPLTPLNFLWTKGTPFTYTLVIRDPSGRRLPLVGYHAALHLRAQASDATPLAILTTENGLISVDAAAGELTIALSTAAIVGITWTTALYDCLLIDPQGVETRLASGTITIATGITRLTSGVPLPLF
jgi:hypothetical protein